MPSGRRKIWKTRHQPLIQIYTETARQTRSVGIACEPPATAQSLHHPVLERRIHQRTGFCYPLSALNIRPGSGDIFSSPEDQLKKEALQALSVAEEKMLKGGYDLLVLDEINIAIYRGFITLEQVLALLDKKPASLELILTGRYAPEALIQRADLVTEMRPSNTL